MCDGLQIRRLGFVITDRGEHLLVGKVFVKLSSDPSDGRDLLVFCLAPHLMWRYVSGPVDIIKVFFLGYVTQHVLISPEREITVSVVAPLTS